MRSNDPPHWTFLCVFDQKSADPVCATGFKPYNATFPGYQTLSEFRHNGGWVDDVDGDAWDDIHLPYLKYILSISGQSGAQIGLASFDVAQTPPSSPAKWFHSGRFYASFTSFNAANGNRRVLISSGRDVGSFSDHFCNVSRFVAVAKWENSLQLLWSNYLSFLKTAFREPWSINNYVRWGDQMNGCVHRTSDSLFQAGSKKVVLYSSFASDPPANNCQDKVLCEQQKISLGQDYHVCGYEACTTANFLPVKGRWTVTVLDADNGGGVNAWPGAYLWGRVANFSPNQPYALMVETFNANGGKVRFDKVGHVPELFYFSNLDSSFVWHHFGSIVRGKRPKLLPRYNYYGAHPAGLGHTFAGIPELVTADIDSDGFNDVQLEDGSWIGFRVATGTIVVK